MRLTVSDILIDSGTIISTSQGRRLVIQGAVKLNGVVLNRLEDLDVNVSSGDIIEAGSFRVSADEYFEEMEIL